MRIINNQNILLLDEVNKAITTSSKVYLSCNHFTALALFELIPSLSNAHSIEFLLSMDFNQLDDFRLIHSNSENKLELSLDRKYKLNQVIELIEKKIQIRHGGIGNQNVLIIEDKGKSTCFTLTPLDFDSLCLGVVSSKTPIFITCFEDAGNQFLGLFQNTWSNSKSLINVAVTERLKKGTVNLTPEAL